MWHSVCMLETVENVVMRNNAHEVEILRLGSEIVSATVKLGDKYLALCVYVRTNQIHPRIVARTLGLVGFNRNVASEINRVANSSDEMWEDYHARRIGFRKTLLLTRGTVSAMESVGVSGEEIRPAMEEAEKVQAVEASEVAAEMGHRKADPKGYAIGYAILSGKRISRKFLHAGIKSWKQKFEGGTLEWKGGTLEWRAT